MSPQALPAVVLLLAHERSGTHLLRSVLSKNGLIAAPGEICNAAAYEEAPDPLSFFKFRYEFSKIGTSPWIPTAKNQEELLSRYLEFLQTQFAQRQTLILDVKYSHVHNFNHFWWDFSHRPFLISFAKSRKIPIIHLIRKKVYQTAISTFYAQESGIWRAQEPGELRQVAIDVNIEKLRNTAFHLSRAISLFSEWLQNCRTLTITYEDLVGSDPRACLTSIARFIGSGEKLVYAPGYIKTTPPYREAISNFDEVANLLDIDFDRV